ncbi:hypothetical protein [Salinicola aestuarinus]|nr:hypothetical protein [Salinicola aestuarinus]
MNAHRTHEWGFDDITRPVGANETGEVDNPQEGIDTVEGIDK